ncbi:MAG TPA: TIGR03085 family metal-binding protein [Nocardioidaceae bacterium]|nr:TIGR03085 family metal-binding protein [Nocardioidaceae bacterium]
MSPLARTERAALCDTALEVGPDRPTLCEGWTVKDLVVHLLVREGSPAAVGIQVAALAGLTASVSRRVGRRDFPDLVERLRGGPPRLSPLAIPRLDALANTLEFFVHHEDIRRAQPGWAPRTLGADADRRLWLQVRPLGRRLVREAPAGVRIENAVTGSVAVLRQGDSPVTVRGLPGEVTLYLFGRTSQASVELLGDAAAVARLADASLGV